MKRSQVRRFTAVEVVYHAIQLILYLLLFISGGVLIVSRTFELEGFGGSMLSNIHRIGGLVLVGFLLQTIVISAFAKNFNSLWKTLLESFKWQMNDVRWLILMPLNIINPNVKLPLSGRFNPGQKLHLLVILCELIVFSITGLIMILLPGIIGAWTLHAIFFIPAILFLGIHMFLSLLNPATRKALKGMVTGYVSEQYIEEHHPLMNHPVVLNISDSGLREKHISLVSIVLTFVGLIFIIITLFWFAGFGRVKSQVVKVAKNSGREAIMPGALAVSHYEAPETKECSSCHNYMEKPTNSKCLECHKEIRSVIDNKTGYHGTFSQNCNSCHGEHNGLKAELRPLNAKSFNHVNSRYLLQGRHQQLDCVKCHEMEDEKTGRKRLKYLNLKFDKCTDCHRNPHPNYMDKDNCLTCHTMQGWSKKELVFDHTRDSKYKLKGEHIVIECEKCHESSKDESGGKQIQLIKMGMQCADCHDDPHNNQFEKECNDCHIENGWKAPWLVEFHGEKSTYPLKGAHKDVKCAKCHNVPDDSAEKEIVPFKGISTDCTFCHEDKHEGQIDKICAACHTENGWKGENLLFVHNEDSTYELDDLHSTISCSLCHLPDIDKVTQYKPVPTECAECHNDIVDYINGKSALGIYKADPHVNRVTCVDCHTVNKKERLPYDYAQKCASCHNPHYYNLYFDWEKSIAIEIKDLLNNLNDVSQKEELDEKLKIIKTISFHNIQMVHELFNSLK